MGTRFAFAWPEADTSTLDDPLYDPADIELFAQSYGDFAANTPAPKMPPIWATGVNRNLSLARGLIYAIPLWERQGAPAELFSGKKFALNGQTWQPTEMGINWYSNRNNPASINPQRQTVTDFTVSLWLAPGELVNECLALLINGSNNTSNATTSILAYVRGNTIAVEFGTDGFTRYDGTTSITTTDQWHHVVIGRKSGTVYAYFDGKYQQIATGVTVSLTNTTITLGGQFNNDGIQWHGALADIAMWNRSLSQSEVLDLYRNPWRLYDPAPHLAVTLNNFNFDSQAYPAPPMKHGLGFRRDLPLARGVVHAYPLWERTGKQIHNLANGYTASLIGTTDVPQWEPTTRGIAPHFQQVESGTNGYILDVPKGLTDFSFSIWVTVDSTLALSDSGQAITLWNGAYQYSIAARGSLQVTCGSSAYNYNPVTPNAWYHFVLTRQNNVCTLYVNGVPFGGTVTDSTLMSNLTSITLGNVYSSGFDEWVGFIQNYLLWDRALTASEAQDLYNNPWRLYTPETIFSPWQAQFDPSLETPSGGFKLGSNTGNQVAFDPLPLGGFALGGSVAPYGGQHVFPVGGFVLGDAGPLPTYDTTVNPTGGFILGSATQVGEIEHTGGTFVLGSATAPSVHGYQHPLGGFVLGGVQFPNGYLYRVEVTVNALPEDLYGWVRPFALTLAPLVTKQTVLVTDLNNVPLASQIIEWDTANGFLSFYVKLNAIANTQTRFYIYFG